MKPRWLSSRTSLWMRFRYGPKGDEEKVDYILTPSKITNEEGYNCIMVRFNKTKAR